MRQFSRYLIALGRNFLSVVYAMVGSALFALPGEVRAALTRDNQAWLDSKLTFDVSVVRKAYLILIPLGFFGQLLERGKKKTMLELHLKRRPLKN